MLTRSEIEATEPEGELAQSRLARAVLAFLTADPLLSADVFLEVALDARGNEVALAELTLAAVTGLGFVWANKAGDRDDLIAFIRSQLAGLSDGDLDV